MTKASKGIKGSFLKVEKVYRGKRGKYFKGEGMVSSYGAQKSCKRKSGKFLKERKSFLMTQEKKKAVITQKRKLLTKGGRNF